MLSDGWKSLGSCCVMCLGVERGSVMICAVSEELRRFDTRG